MADQTTEKPEATLPIVGGQEPESDGAKVDQTESTPIEGGKEEPQEGAKEESKEDVEGSKATADQTEDEKPADDATEDTSADVEMKDDAETTAGNESTVADTAETPAKGKSTPRRKSAAGESKSKTLSKKASKAKLVHSDAKPGDLFLIKLRGYPAWPAIICDESMLPHALVSNRPVSAAKPDGSYNEAYADGGKRVHDRTFPVMYLHTNEFGWAANSTLTELTPEKAAESINDKMRKDLKSAFELAAENNSLDHYKELLQQFQEELIAQEEAALQEAKEAAATPKKGAKKAKSKVNDDDDLEMADAVDSAAKPKSKKRKAEEDVATPQRSDSVKKPKIKLNTTPKAANGSAKKTKEEPPKSKVKKGKEGVSKKSEASKESTLTPEEQHARRKQEVMYLRHKLQRNLLKPDQKPQDEEIEQMSNFVRVLENLDDLEASIIRETKINKVMKGIIKLESIPRESEFSFKKRSQTLLDKWNKLLAAEAPSTNGVNGSSSKPTIANGEATKTDEAKDGEEKKESELEDKSAKDKSEEAEAKEPVAEETKTETAATPVEATA